MVTVSLGNDNVARSLSSASDSFSFVVKMNCGVSPGNALFTVLSFKSGLMEDKDVLAIALVFRQFLYSVILQSGSTRIYGVRSL